MQRFTRLFRKRKPILAPSPVPPLVLRRDFDEYARKMRQVIHYDVLDMLGKLTDEERYARNTRQLPTPSEPTLYDANYTRAWDIYNAVTAGMATCFWVYAEE